MSKSNKKKTIPRFAKMLCDGDIKVLEGIFHHCYDEYLFVFHILREYLDDIIHIQYRNQMETPMRLKIVVTMHSEADANDLYDQINSMVNLSQDYHLDLLVENNLLIINVWKLLREEKEEE